MSPKLCQSAPETSSTTAHNGPGERARLGRTNTRPRGLDSKKCGRRPVDIFDRSGAGAHPTAPEAGALPETLGATAPFAL
jgi:hypothetical protein